MELSQADKTHNAARAAADAEYSNACMAAEAALDAAIRQAAARCEAVGDETEYDAARTAANAAYSAECIRASNTYAVACAAALAAYADAETPTDSASATLPAPSPIHRITRIDEQIAHHQDMVRQLLIERGDEVRSLIGNRHGGMAWAARELGVSQTQVARLLADNTVRRVAKVLLDHDIAGWCTAVAGRGASASIVLNGRENGITLPLGVREIRAQVIVFRLSEAGLIVEFSESRTGDVTIGLDGALAVGRNLVVRVPPVEG